MSTLDRIKSDLMTAMRAQDKQTLGTLRLITAAIKQVEVDERIVVDEERLISILKKLAKQRKESITQFSAAGRNDLVAQEQSELDLIQHYLPEQMSEAELIQLIDKAIADTGAAKISDMGKVMSQMKSVTQGRADMSQVSSLIKARLS